MQSSDDANTSTVAIARGSVIFFGGGEVALPGREGGAHRRQVATDRTLQPPLRCPCAVYPPSASSARQAGGGNAMESTLPAVQAALNP
jgi:hypothetical protein